ncbi:MULTISPECIES: DUF6074 family protein [unclassified Mesorhizobium]|uniref:DUF6074 family protein n=1 Tax=unclassified Mesorhizobium TaxID=325217 RepID=UPI003014AD95
MNQLSLLNWCPPNRIIAFPLSRRRSLVLRTAEMLTCIHGDEASMFWRHLIVDLRTELDARGMPADAIRAELNAFFDAVQIELQSRHFRDQQPGGVA